MEERIALMQAYDTGGFSVSELCRRFNISRDTFYRLKSRRANGDGRWFEDQSRAPKSVPHATPDAVRAQVIAMRERFPRFGPKKLHAMLAANDAATPWPCPSTIGEILKAEGLIQPKRRRRRAIVQGDIVAGAQVANGEWAIDFKGWFRTRDGTRCDPLTVSDTASRYLLEARITPPNHDGAKAVLAKVFRNIGLPDAIRSDNGTPFGSQGAGGLSRLSVWFLKLGIEPRFIPPSSPQDNGRHERMHRTMKAETSRPAAATLKHQQVRFDRFRCHYNDERPHESLDQTTPATHWRRPLRTLPKMIEEPWYDANHEVRRVRTTGEIKWRGAFVFISEVVRGETIGLAEVDLGLHIVRFCNHELGVLGRDGRFHRFAPPRARLRKASEPDME